MDRPVGYSKKQLIGGNYFFLQSLLNQAGGGGEKGSKFREVILGGCVAFNLCRSSDGSCGLAKKITKNM